MPKTLRGRGDAIEGEKVICTARKVIVKKPAKGSSRHRIQRVILEKNVRCVIARPWRYKKK